MIIKKILHCKYMCWNFTKNYLRYYFELYRFFTHNIVNSTYFLPHLKQNNILYRYYTSLECSVNFLRNVRAVFACFTETRGIGLNYFSSTLSIYLPQKNSIISSSVKVSETAMSSSISLQCSNGSSLILQLRVIKVHFLSVSVFSIMDINASSSALSKNPHDQKQSI